jgi:hypothetical protein
VSEVGLLLGTSQTLAFLGLGLVVLIAGVVLGGGLARSLVLGDTLSLGFLSRSGSSGGLGLGLFSLLGFLSLSLGVFGVPRVDDLGWSVGGSPNKSCDAHRCPPHLRTFRGGRRQP